MSESLNLREKKKEIRNFLRNSDIISITDRGVTTHTDLFSGDSSITDFELTNSGVKNIRTININGSPLVFGKDYFFIEDVIGTETITTVHFDVPPITGTDNIEIIYDYGIGDRIYDDFPQDFVTINSYPRLGFDIINSNSTEMALGGVATQNNILLQVSVFGIGKKQAEELLDDVRELFLDNKHNFYYWNFITIDSLGSLIVTDVKGGKVFQRSLDLRAEFEFEGIEC